MTADTPSKLAARSEKLNNALRDLKELDTKPESPRPEGKIMYKEMTAEQRYEGIQRRIACIESFLNCPAKVPRYDALVAEKAALELEMIEIRATLNCGCGSGLPFYQCGETTYCT